MAASTLTSKGQVTIPKVIRRQLQLRQGHRLEFYLDASGRLILKPLNHDIRALKGVLRSGRKQAPSLAEMEAAIARGFGRA